MCIGHEPDGLHSADRLGSGGRNLINPSRVDPKRNRPSDSLDGGRDLAILDAMAASPELAAASRFWFRPWYTALGAFGGSRLVCRNFGCDDLAAVNSKQSVNYIPRKTQNTDRSTGKSLRRTVWLHALRRLPASRFVQEAR